MAKCYGDLVMELWSGTQKNVAPLKLRVRSCSISSILVTKRARFLNDMAGAHPEEATECLILK